MNVIEKVIDKKLLKIEPTIILKNMDITEKLLYLDYLNESKQEKENELKNSVLLEEILKREEISIEVLQKRANNKE